MGKSVPFFMALCLLCFVSAAGANETFSPWDFTHREIKDAASSAALSGPASLLKGGLVIFSRHISPVDGDRCHMYPTCSAYSREAVEKHGFLGGGLLTIDRLLHERNEMDRAPQIMMGDRLRYLDPVSNNDFWWHDGR